MSTIKTSAYPDEKGEIEITAKDWGTGEETEDIRIEITTEYSQAWVHLTTEDAVALIKELSYLIGE